ncbi:NAD(P)-binding protein [Thozetella sp. PMI_491]|nr:NAD(P)-binding protein [Thozetella sp. PMI_491]
MAGDLVLLTGASGFIGFRVLVLLLQGGYRVRAAVRNPASFEKIKSLKSASPYVSQMESIIIPDITVPGAYDDAVKGVKYIIHMASPFASPDLFGTDYEISYIQPAVRGTVGMLESAVKVAGIERIVITASILSIASFSVAGTETLIDESHRSATSHGPYPDWVAAYSASKARAFEATEQWMAENKPSFNLINIEPTFVLGRDETITDPSAIGKGANGVLIGPILGQASTQPSPGVTVHVDDVALMHVRSLDPKIRGSQDFLANSHPPKGIEWSESFDIIKKHYPKQTAEGIFKVDTTERPPTAILRVDSTKAEKTFGFTFKSFEEQVLSVASQYLELVGQK